jgi:hypothetical protein
MHFPDGDCWIVRRLEWGLAVTIPLGIIIIVFFQVRSAHHDLAGTQGW